MSEFGDAKPIIHHYYNYDELDDDRKWTAKEETLAMQTADKPFSKGAFREAYKALLNGEQVVVLKKFIKKPEDERKDVEQDIIIQSTARHFSELFDAENPPKKIDVISASMVELEGSFYALEPFIEGEYVKHQSNSGFVDTDHIRNTPHAFSHFTWHASNHTLIVVDVQGVGDRYTDPAIHSVAGSYGDNDLAIRGIALYFFSHECSNICNGLHLPTFPIHNSDKMTVVRRGATLWTLQDSPQNSPETGHAIPGLQAAGRKSKTSSSNGEVHFALGCLNEVGRLAPLRKLYSQPLSARAALENSAEAEPDHIAAHYHWTKAAKLGHVESMMILALTSSGHPSNTFCLPIAQPNPILSVKFLKKAAKTRRCAALHLGEMFLAQKKFKEAVEYLSAASALPKVVPGKDPLTNFPVGVWANTDDDWKVNERLAMAYEGIQDYMKSWELYTAAADGATAAMKGKDSMRLYEKAEEVGALCPE